MAQFFPFIYIYSATVRQSLMKTINPAQFGCNVPSVSDAFPVDTVIECAQKCVSLDYCLFIQVTTTIGGEIDCVTTDMRNTNNPNGVLTDGVWYQII